MDQNKYFVDVLYIMSNNPFVTAALESRDRPKYVRELADFNKNLTDDQRKMYNSLSDEEKFVYYNLSPDDRMKFDETMKYSGLNIFINAPGRSGGRKSRKSRRSRKTKRRRSRHR